MRKGTDAYLRRHRQLLSFLDAGGRQAQVIWRSENLGSWESISARWWEERGRLRLRFKTGQRDWQFWLSSIKAAVRGPRLLLTSPQKPVPEVLQIVWSQTANDMYGLSDNSWEICRRWLRERFAGWQILAVTRRSDLARSLSAAFLRVHFKTQGRDCFLIIAESGAENDTARSALTQALLWVSSVCGRRRHGEVFKVFVLVPPKYSGLLYHRARFLNPQRVDVEIWEYDDAPGEGLKLNRTTSLPAPVEERDFRWPVLGPFRWSPQLSRVIDLAPESIRRYPRFQDYDSLRLCGLEFANVAGPARDRICFGVGMSKTELTEDNFQGLSALVKEILLYRRPDTPDVRHPLYRAQAERWLEALILEESEYLFPELVAESVYSQIPVYLGKDPGRVDILGVDRQGNLVVMELKASEDPDLPLQSLDYWGRVIQHSLNGDFEKRGYFSGTNLSRGLPRIYLVSPVFSFHDSTEQILGYLEPSLEVCKIAVNEDWRGGIRILHRSCLRCGDLT